MKLFLELFELLMIFISFFTVIIGTPMGIAWIIHLIML